MKKCGDKMKGGMAQKGLLGKPANKRNKVAPKMPKGKK